jgi:DDE_Tnp_1-associated
MPVSHAPETTVTSENRAKKKVPGLLEMLAQVPDLRKRRGRRYELVFVLAVAACCALAGAKTYREIGDQAADLPQDVLARLGGRIHPLKRAIIAPSEKRIRTLIQAIDAERLDQIIGGWLRALAQAGKLEPLLTSLDARRGTPEVLAQVTRGQWGIEPVHWPRHRLAGRPEHRLRRERPPGHGVPEHSRSACCISPGSPRSSGPSRQSAMTGTASSTTCRYKTPIASSPPTTLPIPWVNTWLSPAVAGCRSSSASRLTYRPNVSIHD